MYDYDKNSDHGLKNITLFKTGPEITLVKQTTTYKGHTLNRFIVPISSCMIDIIYTKDRNTYQTIPNSYVDVLHDIHDDEELKKYIDNLK